MWQTPLSLLRRGSPAVIGVGMLAVAACSPSTSAPGTTSAPSTVTAATSAPSTSGSSSSSAASSSQPWTIAIVGPYAGNLAATGDDFKTSANLYVSQQNAKGGWVGRQINLQFVDEGNSDANGGATAAQSVATNPDVLAVFGHFSSSSALAGGPIYQKAGIPFIATTASSPVVTQGGNQWLFRSGGTAVQEGINSVSLIKKLGKSKVAIVYSSADFGKAQDQYVAKDMRDAGFQVVSENDYQPGAQDFSSIISKLKDVQPDFVWLGMYDAEAGPFMQQARSAGLDSTFAGSGAILTDDFLKLAGEAANGVYGDSAPLSVQAQSSPDLAAFVDAYRSAYQKDPDNFAESMYSDFQIVGQSLTAGATDRQSLRDKMASAKDLKDVSDIASFDENRDAVLTQQQISVVQDQKWQLFATFK